MQVEFKLYHNLNKGRINPSFIMFNKTIYYIMSNCDGKIHNIGMGCCEPVLAPIEYYYTKWQTERYVSGFTYSKEEIDEKTSGHSSGCCITPEEVDERIASAKTEIEAEIPSLSAYSTTEQMNTVINQSVSGKANASDVQALSGEVQTLSSNTQTISGNLQTLSAEVQTIVISGVSGISSAECQTMIDNSISGKADTSSLAAVATSGNYNDLTNKPTIPTVPTSNTAFTNDAGYATSGYVSTAVSGKQDTLSAGTNISINNNVISAIDTTYEAGNGIVISGNTIMTETKFQCLTEQEWSSISGNPQPNTYYFIH